MIHGNNSGVPKLIKEFREFWHLKTNGGTPQDTNATETMETDQDTQSTSPKSPTEEKSYSISKRQLHNTIKRIAVYEKRKSFKKNCWYVNDDVIKKYDLKDLPVPTNWQWITRPQPEIEAASTATVGSGGRMTPNLKSDTPKQMTADITKFTVAGLTPKPLPLPVPKTEMTPKRRSIADMLSTQKSDRKDNTPKRIATTEVLGAVDECIVVDKANIVLSKSKKMGKPKAEVPDEGKNNHMVFLVLVCLTFFLLNFTSNIILYFIY